MLTPFVSQTSLLQVVIGAPRRNLGFLGVSVYVDGDNALYTHAASLDNLKSYCERMRARYFPETVRGPAARATKVGEGGGVNRGTASSPVDS